MSGVGFNISEASVFNNHPEVSDIWPARRIEKLFKIILEVNFIPFCCSLRHHNDRGCHILDLLLFFGVLFGVSGFIEASFF